MDRSSSEKPDTSKNVICPRLRINYGTDERGDSLITIKHMTEEFVVVSECVFSPEEAYEYAQSILKAYDALSEDE